MKYEKKLSEISSKKISAKNSEEKPAMKMFLKNLSLGVGVKQ